MPCVTDAALDLDTEIRFHRATVLPAFVAGLLDDGDRAEENARLASELAGATYNLRITRSLEEARARLAWGTDLVRLDQRWSADRARGYQRGSHVRSPFQLRVNAYRVLLPRARDGVAVFVPPLACLDETYAYLVASGFKALA